MGQALEPVSRQGIWIVVALERLASSRRNTHPRVGFEETALQQEASNMTTRKESSEQAGNQKDAGAARVRAEFHGVRYQVNDVERSVAFYTQTLGFTVEHRQLPAFANVSLGGLSILLSGPGASGSRAMPSGQRQEPGGWNRVVLRVEDLEPCIEVLKKAGCRLRNEMEVGPGGKQIQIEDPDGNPIELFEPARRSH
jgi:glyoxylase I family protein